MDDCYYDSDDLDVTQYSDSDSEGVEMLFLDPQGGSKSREAVRSSWTVIDEENLRAAQGKALEQVTSILGCSTSVARAVLIQYGWDENVLFGEYTPPLAT
mmetsp:Transcript_6665/g.18599  ORF Transcript_6665/g.18599 Transcript_6665/m.18599 type:complete len:100 (-) Transcript_6665:2031-2330(-)